MTSRHCILSALCLAFMLMGASPEAWATHKKFRAGSDVSVTVDADSGDQDYSFSWQCDCPSKKARARTEWCVRYGINGGEGLWGCGSWDKLCAWCQYWQHGDDGKCNPGYCMENQARYCCTKNKCSGYRARPRGGSKLRNSSNPCVGVVPTPSTSTGISQR